MKQGSAKISEIDLLKRRVGELERETERMEQRRRLEERRADERLRLILESAVDFAIFTLDRKGIVTSWNSGAERLLGYDEDEIIGRNARIIFTPEDCDRQAPEWEIRTAKEQGRAEDERWHLRKDGSRFWGSGLMMPLRDDPEGGLLKIMRDDTKRRRAEEVQRLLIGELNHRVKNTLATVQSLTEQTLRTTESPQAFASALRNRLFAMARAHDLLTRERWEGASLEDILRAALAPWLQESRITLSGPYLHLGAQQALALTMAFHELATNAVKHGSLSAPEGRLKVAWKVGADVVIEWNETGGPMVSPPQKQGFGSRVLNRALAAELGGSVELDFDGRGLRCVIRFERDPEPARPD